MKTLLLKWLKRLGWFFFILLITINLFILLSGRFYLYKGVFYTYLSGETSPTIYDNDIFFSAKVKTSSNKEPWVLNKKQINQSDLSTADRKYVESWGTRSLAVFHGDTLLYEEYWGNHTRNTVSNSFSAAKTVVSLLVGIALDEGKIKSLDDPVSRYLPHFSGKGKDNITIRHLLMMASGLDWGESGKNPLSENAESYYGSDLWGLVHRQHVESEPGKIFRYQSGNSQLLGFILEKATGKKLSEYASEKLWQPIGAESDAFWSLDKENGAEKSFCCLYSTTRDFARIGKLLTHEGKWGDKQIIPTNYFKELITNPTILTEDNIPNFQYGLHIWTYVGGKTPVYYCRGIKGQYIIAIPAENLVIVRTGNKRAPNIDVPENRKKDKNYLQKHQYEIGHPADLFEYIRIGRKLSK